MSIIDHEQKQWEQFVTDHGCRVVETVRGSTIFVPMMIGKTVSVMPIIQPDRYVYRCNDGKDYTRE